MKAVFITGGKQYYVQENDVIYVEKLNADEGSTITFSEVLVLDGKVGFPYVPNAKITCEVVKHGKQKKIKVFKFHAKKKYRRTQGHRQPYTKLLIKKIEG